MPAPLDAQVVTGGNFGGNQVNTGSLSAQPGKRNYVTGIEIIMGGATAATNVDCTMTNTGSGTRHWAIDVPLGVNAPPIQIRETFNPPLPCTAVNTIVNLSLPAGGAGNVVASVAIEGFALNEP